jgi:hypothetical protein
MQTRQQQKASPEIQRAILYSLIVVAASTSGLQALFSLAPEGWELFVKLIGGELFTLSAPSSEEAATFGALIAVVVLGLVLSVNYAMKAVFELEKALPEIRVRDYEVDMDIKTHAAVIAALSYVETSGPGDGRLRPHESLPHSAPLPDCPANIKKRFEVAASCEDGYWNNHPYQHILKAWSHHFIVHDDGKRLFVPPLFIMTSEETGNTKGSDGQLKYLKDVYKALSGEEDQQVIDKTIIKVRILTCLNFEEFDSVKNALEFAFENTVPDKIIGLRNAGEIPSETQVHQPIIDITGGQRTLAIAAASVTLGRTTIPGFSYVSQDTKLLKYYKLTAYERRALLPT